MRRLMAIVCTAVLATGASYGSGLGLFVNQWDPDDGDKAIGYGAKLQFDLSDAVALELRGTYYDDLLDDDDDAELQAIPAELGIVLTLPLGDSPISLYGTAGVGWYFLDGKVGDVDVEIDDEIGWYGGGGAELELAEGFSIFAEATWRVVEATAEADDTDDIDELEGDEEGTLDGLTLAAGIVLNW